MKRIWVLLLLVLLPCCALAAEHTYPTQEERFALAKLNITEVYGWDWKDAETFVFEEVEGTDTCTVRYWPASHPDWIYEQAFSKTDWTPVPAPGGTTPFRTGFEGYPGEGSVRAVLQTAQANQWFRQWDAQARIDYRSLLDNFDVSLGTAALESLSDETSTAADAIQHFFLSCYGEESLWPAPVTQWRNEVLLQNGLQLSPSPDSSLLEPGIAEYTLTRGSTVYRTLRFAGEIPDDLESLLNDPRLTGWECLSGALRTSDDGDTVDVGLAAFGRENERILVHFRRYAQETDWSIDTVTPGVLLSGETPVIRREESGGERYVLQYQLKDQLQIQLHFANSHPFFSILQLEYSQNGSGFRLEENTARSPDGIHVYQLTHFEGNTPASTEVLHDVPQLYLEHMDLNTLLIEKEAALDAHRFTLPDGVAITCGVHLRQKTSSHSKDLGDFDSGTLLEILGTEPGDPFPWYHVRVGQLEGYMSSNYVASLQPPAGVPQERNASILNTRPLSVGAATTETDLRRSIGFFRDTARKLAVGEKMHILAQLDDWYYVVIPNDGVPGRWMDMDGEYGYVRSRDILVGASAAQLDWLLP